MARSIHEEEVAAFAGLVERTPIRARFRCLDVVTTAAPGGGLDLLVALRLLERFLPAVRTATLEHWAAAVALAVDGALYARELFPVAPDDLKPAMVRYLVGDERIDLLARTLRRGAPVISPDQEAPGEATHLVVSEGNVVSLAQSIGSGATPALVLGGSGPVLAVVSPGGRRTTCALVRVISSVIDRGLSIEEAVAATREALATVDARGKLR